MVPPDVVAPAAPLLSVPAWSRPLSFLTRRIKAWGILFVPILVTLAIFATVLPPFLVYEGTCAEETSALQRARRDFEAGERALVQCIEANQALVYFASGIPATLYLLTLVPLATSLAFFSHRRRMKQRRRAYERRIQGIRDHILSGTMPVEAFDSVQQLWKPLTRGQHAGDVARAGTNAALVWNILATLLLGVSLTVMTIGMLVAAAESTDRGYTRPFDILWRAIFIPINVGLAVGVIAGWIKVPRAHRDAVAASDHAVDAAERAEIRILAQGSQGRTRRTAVTMGPSFSPYARRAQTE